MSEISGIPPQLRQAKLQRLMFR